ncbi:MAG TPA: CobW family GTP-binding protein [Steroidobacteraceae bacterium]|nr:CobW family GTP-binding protein [Steroidobacteraceae bacterium]
MSVTSSRVPVTVLTGFLGSGKTTLLNRILSEKHGKRIAVIENEFGEVGVDSELVIGAEEELFETNNGCICCTVRGDLIRILGQLMKRRDKFDYILIETTGMADPGPVAQTFFLDDDLKDKFSLDAIVTMVDAKHFEQHVDELNEPAEQVAFADLVLLNKTDLVDEAALERIERRIRGINGSAKIFRTKNADVPIDRVLNVGAFDLQRALQVDEAFLEPEYPFEWGGVYQLTAGDYLLKSAGEHDHHAHEHAHDHGHDHDHDHDHDHGHDHGNGHDHDHAHEDLELVILPLAAASADALNAAIEPAVRAFADAATVVNCHGDIAPAAGAASHFAIDISHAGADFTLKIAKPGAYALFFEHHPLEFGLRLDGQRPAAERKFASHHHEDNIASVGISDPRPLDPVKLNQWFDYLLKTRGQDIFRMKGVLNVKGEDRRQVFHGVHMMFDAQAERPWGNTPRMNHLVFIGRDLDRAELEAGFESAVAR